MGQDEMPQASGSSGEVNETAHDAAADTTLASSTDPSSVLAAAAAALESLDDPAFEGTPSVEPVVPASGSKSKGVAGNFSKSVLAIETSVAVVLAKQRISVDRIVNMVPGSMLTFEAHCDEPLTLEVGGHAIAVGETVKIGDKLGLRVRQLLHSENSSDS